MNRTLYHSIKNFAVLMFWAAISVLFVWLAQIAASWTYGNWGSAFYGIAPLIIIGFAIISYKVGKNDAEIEKRKTDRIYDILREDSR